MREATAELAEQNELLRRQAFQLEQASAAKSQFLANVSHELRTPLNAIIGYTHLLLEGHLRRARPAAARQARPRRLQRPPPAVDHQRPARHRAHRVGQDAGPARAASMLPELIDEVMAEVEPLIDGTQPDGDARTSSPSVPEIRTDRQKVKQIVLNLLSNALKFTPQGSVSIRLDYERRRSRSRVAVADTRHRHLGGEPEDDLRGVRPGGQLVRQAARRHRPGALDLPPPGRRSWAAGSPWSASSARARRSRSVLPRRARSVMSRTEDDREPPPCVLVVDDVAHGREICAEYLEFRGFRVAHGRRRPGGPGQGLRAAAGHDPDGSLAARDRRLGGHPAPEERRADARRSRSSRSPRTRWRQRPRQGRARRAATRW